MAVRRVLVLRALGLGDLLAAVPALHALREGLPEAAVALAAPAGLAAAVAWTGVDSHVPVGPLEALPAAAHRCDLAVNMHGRGPQSTILLAALRPVRLLAFAHPSVPASAGGPVWDERERERVRWCRLVAALGVPADPDRTAIDVPPGPVPAGAQGATLVHPGTARPAAQWPVERFAAVAEAQARAGHRVLVTGSAAEVPLAREVAERAGMSPTAVLAGRTDLDGLARLVGRAGCLVSADTGIAHLAVALGTPSVTIFGPVDPALWGPPPARPAHRVLWAGRTGDSHARTPFAGLRDVSVAAVLAALDDLVLAPAGG